MSRLATCSQQGETHRLAKYLVAHFSLMLHSLRIVISQNRSTEMRIFIVLAAIATAAGCTHLGYYLQAAHGQFSLLSQAKPIDEWLADPQTDVKLRNKLSSVQRIRRFAASELALPNNQSYTAYADLKRPYALWNVVATPALSMEPKKWCFPIAGCVSYRGYYGKQDAQSYAGQLRSEGYDVQVGGVAAYSTLGWFSDPILSTFIQYPEGELARLIFHELAHQVAYAPGDSQFNESFATAVEEAGVERWLEQEGSDEMREAFKVFRQRKQQFVALLLAARAQLAALYDGHENDAVKYQEKGVIFENLRRDYEVLKVSWGGYKGYDRFFAEPLSNAHLSDIATYNAYVPAFRMLLAKQGELAAFFTAVKALADLPHDERTRAMKHLASELPADSNVSVQLTTR